MRKTLQLGEKTVQFASHGATAIFYRKEFGADFFADAIKLAKNMESFGTEGSIDLKTISYEQIEAIDLTLIYRLAYIFAMSANKDIEPYIEWLSSLDEFPLSEVTPLVFDLMFTLLERKKKKKMSETLVKNL